MRQVHATYQPKATTTISTLNPGVYATTHLVPSASRTWTLVVGRVWSTSNRVWMLSGVRSDVGADAGALAPGNVPGI